MAIDRLQRHGKLIAMEVEVGWLVELCRISWSSEFERRVVCIALVCTEQQ